MIAACTLLKIRSFNKETKLFLSVVKEGNSVNQICPEKMGSLLTQFRTIQRDTIIHCSIRVLT